MDRTEYMSLVSATFSYKGEQFVVQMDWFPWSDRHDTLEETFALAEYMFTEGNYSCDCNRSLFIGRHASADLPEMECGEEIELICLEVTLHGRVGVGNRSAEQMSKRYDNICPNCGCDMWRYYTDDTLERWRCPECGEGIAKEVKP
jgi:hypothetical protein